MLLCNPLHPLSAHSITWPPTLGTWEQPQSFLAHSGYHSKWHKILSQLDFIQKLPSHVAKCWWRKDDFLNASPATVLVLRTVQDNRSGTILKVAPLDWTQFYSNKFMLSLEFELKPLLQWIHHHRIKKTPHTRAQYSTRCITCWVREGMWERVLHVTLKHLPSTGLLWRKMGRFCKCSRACDWGNV